MTERNRLLVMCDPSYISFVECLMRLPAAREYRITCGRLTYWDVKSMNALEWANKSPFHPVINIHPDPTLREREWFITAVDENGKDLATWGSEGL